MSRRATLSVDYIYPYYVFRPDRFRPTRYPLELRPNIESPHLQSRFSLNLNCSGGPNSRPQSNFYPRPRVHLEEMEQNGLSANHLFYVSTPASVAGPIIKGSIRYTVFSLNTPRTTSFSALADSRSRPKLFQNDSRPPMIAAVQSTSAFVGTNPTEARITFGLPVIRPDGMRRCSWPKPCRRESE